MKKELELISNMIAYVGDKQYRDILRLMLEAIKSLEDNMKDPQ